MSDELVSESSPADQDEENGPLQPDPNLVLLGDRAVAAGLKGWWRRYKNPKTGDREGPYSLQIDLPSGRGSRPLYLHAEDAEALIPFPFERWIMLGDYEAFLDVHEGRIVAEVDLTGSGAIDLHRLSQNPVTSSRIGESETPSNTDVELTILTDREKRPTLALSAPHGRISLELSAYCPAEIAALKKRRSNYGYGLTIHGVTATRHDEALQILVDLSTSFFIDLDISYGLTARLTQAVDFELLAQDDYDRDLPSTAAPRFPNTLYNKEAAALYLYARHLIRMPLLEYLAYYQVIEFHLPLYTRSATIIRIRNMIKDPGFDHNNDYAIGRLLEAIAPTGRKIINERDQIAATISHCVDDPAIAAFLKDRPVAAKALADKNRIRSVRVINTREQQIPLVGQVAERIYDLRCRIVHGKEDGGDSTPPLRPFDRESRLLRHDLSLIRFVAQRVLISSSRPPSW